MMFTNFRYYVLLLFFVPLTLAGQEENAIVTLDLLNEDDGMRNSYVKDVMIDSRGLIWLATSNGLHMYDGYSFMIYDDKADSPAQLSSLSIYSVVEDSLGQIWIGTDNGINLLNPSTQEVTMYFNKGNTEFPPIAGAFKSSKLLKDKDNKIWFLTGGQCGYFHQGKAFFDYTGLLPPIQDFYLDRYNSIYLSPHKEEVLYRLTQERKLKKLDQVIVNGVPHQLVGTDVYLDENGELNSVHTDGFTYKLSAEGDTILKTELKPYSLNDIVDKLINGKIDLNIPSFSSGQSNIVHKLLDVACGEDQFYWLATNLGLIKVSVQTSGFKNEPKLNNASLRAFYQHNNEDIYIGAYAPLHFIKYNQETKELVNFDNILNTWDVFPYNEDTLVIINDGLPTFRLFDVNQQKIVYSRELKDLYIMLRGLLILEDGILVFGSERGGLFQTNIHNLDSVSNFNLSKPDPVLENIKVNHLFQKSKEVFWIATTNAFLTVDIRNSIVERHVITDKEEQIDNPKEIWDIYEVSPDLIWLATDKGLCRYDPINKRSRFYTTDDGLSDNLVYNILPQDSLVLWLSTNNRLSRLDIKNETFSIYSEADGISYREFNRNSALKTKEGRFYFGGLNGFTSFYPEEVVQKKASFKPFISTYSIYDRTSDKLVSFIPERENGQTIYLDPDNRNITFTLGLTDYRSPLKANFEVFLQGFDKNWISNKNRREIRYTNLNAGNYIFRVRATNADGQTSKEEDFIRLVVVKPWYTSFWFYGLLSLLIFGAIMSMYLSRVAYERKSNRLRNRIANDLHDEVSNTLNNIRIVTQDAKRITGGPSTKDVAKIEEMSTYAIEHLQDVIWAIDLENQDIKYLLFRMEDNIDLLLRNRQIPVEINKVALDEEAELDFLHRRNLLLIFKEALSNIIKHSVSSRVIITIGNIGGQFTLSVKNEIAERLESKYKTGRGAISMTQRAQALDGTLEVKDTANAYEVILKLKHRL